MRRSGLLLTVAALALAIAAVVVVRATATESVLFVSQLMGLALAIFAGALLTGFSRVLSLSTVPVFGAVLIEAGFADDPSWIRSLVIGCLWFVTLEVGTEAVDRRDGSRRTPASIARRVQEVALVVGLALVIGLVAALATDAAPSRTVLLQAAILGAVLTSFVFLIRRVAVAPPN